MTKRQATRDAKQLYRLCLVDGILDDSRVLAVVRATIAAGHRGSALVLARFLRLVRLDRQRHTVTIESAGPLPRELQDAMVANLAERYGKGLIAAFSERPALIGGMRIQVGSDLYDGSVSGRLAALQARF